MPQEVRERKRQPEKSIDSQHEYKEIHEADYDTRGLGYDEDYRPLEEER